MVAYAQCGACRETGLGSAWIAGHGWVNACCGGRPGCWPGSADLSGAGLVPVIGWAQGFPSLRQKSRVPAAEQLELAARRHRHPAPLQVLHAPDGHGYRLVIDPGKQVLQRRVVCPGHPVPDPGRGVRAITPAVGHAVRDQLGPAVSRREPLASPGTGCRPGDDPPLLLALGVAGRCRMAGCRVRPGGQFSPQTVSDAEQGLDDQMRKVMDDVNRSAQGGVARS